MCKDVLFVNSHHLRKQLYKRGTEQLCHSFGFETFNCKVSMVDQLLCSTVYGLNKSFSKKTLIGIKVLSKGELQAVVRLVGSDYADAKFTSV